MFNNIRLKIGTKILKKADQQLKEGHYKPAFRNISLAVQIVPNSEALQEMGKKMKVLATKITEIDSSHEEES